MASPLNQVYLLVLQRFASSAPLFAPLVFIFAWYAEDPADDTHSCENPQRGCPSW